MYQPNTKFYSVTKTFVSGLLKGITITETTPVKFEIGKVYKACAGSSDYRIDNCAEVLL